MRLPGLLLALVAVVAGCDLFQPPPTDRDVVTGDTLEACAPDSALVPFFLSIARAGEDADAVATNDLFASGQAYVMYVGAATGALVDAGFQSELRLLFYDDPREVVIGLAFPHDTPALAVTLGETLWAVVARQPLSVGANLYVALRGTTGDLRAWLVKGAEGGLPSELGRACPLGFECPVAAFSEPDCAPVPEECGARVWPPLAIRPSAAGDPIVLRQGQRAVVGSAGQAWTFLVAYASRFDGDITCTDVASSSLAAAVLFGVSP